MRINISSIKINVQVRPFQLYVHFVVAVEQDRNVDGRWTFTFCVTARKYKREKKGNWKKALTGSSFVVLQNSKEKNLLFIWLCRLNYFLKKQKSNKINNVMNSCDRIQIHACINFSTSCVLIFSTQSCISLGSKPNYINTYPK